jgi:hypothetical protein
MAFAGEATAAPILVLLTLLIQNTGMATIIHWIRVRHNTRYVPAWRGRLLPFDGAIHECDLCPTFVTDPDVVWILSLEVFSIVAVGVLLLGIQLFDGRLWRRSSAAGMAELGANRKCYRCADVWSFHGTFVCHRTQAR